MSETIIKRESRTVWFERIQDWNQSGLSKADYCRQNKLNPASFYKWFAKFQPSGENEPSCRSAFTTVKLTAEPLISMTIQCGDISIAFHGPVSPEQALPWIRVLRSSAC